MDNIFRNWERVLRWAYPGGLFFVLLLFSPDSCIRDPLFNPELDIVLKLLAFFSIGVFIYLMQNFFVRWFSKLFTWIIRKSFSKCHCSLRDRYSTHITKKIEETMIIFDPEKNPTYNDDLWARYHAVNISAWLPLIFIICHDINKFWLVLPLLIWLLNLHYYYYVDGYAHALAKKKSSAS